MPAKPSQYLVALVGCHHALTFEVNHLPDVGEVVWCQRCQEYRSVRHRIGMYRASCDSCRFARWYGAAKITAQTMADRHVRKFPTHLVIVTLGSDGVSVHPGNRRNYEGTQLSLPIAADGSLDLPPF